MKPAETILHLPHGPLRLPAFLPDATLGVVRAVDSSDLLGCGVEALVMNTFHLMQHPGSSTIRALGGLHRMCGWPRPIVTDSGGFQAYSLVHQNPKYGQLTDKGLTFRPEGTGRKFNLSPEKTVQLQLGYGADVIFCLDDCTHVDEPLETQQASVERTADWARRGKAEFQRLVEQKGIPPEGRPLLFAVVQGGGLRELRRRCAGELLEIGFDGFGYGGWPLDREGNLLLDIIAYTRELVPAEFPMQGLGIGQPASIAQCVGLGYMLFDSAMPTRDARHGRLYAFNVDPSSSHPSARSGRSPDRARPILTGDWFSYVYVQDKKHIKAARPISQFCDCLCCTRYSLGYLCHLYEVNDGLYQRLATIHNLRFMAQLMASLGSG